MNTAYADVIAEQEKELQSLRLQLRTSERETSRQGQLFSQKDVQLRAFQSLTAGLLGQLSDEQVFDVVCRDLVYSVQASAAICVRLNNNEFQVISAVGASQGQLRQLERDGAKTPAWFDVYLSRKSISTSTATQHVALALRVLFNSDEVAAVPVVYADQLFGYLIVLNNGRSALNHPSLEVGFLQLAAGVAGQAIENGRTFLGLEARNTKLREVDELKDAFISIVSHQLRTPLSIIKWILATLQENPELKVMEKTQDLLAQANIGNERLIHIVNDLLNVSRVESGTLPFNPQLLDVSTLLRDLVSNVEGFVTSKGLRISSFIPKSLPAVCADRQLLRQAIQNLLDNAISYANTGTEIEVEAILQERAVCIRVSDTGLPILFDNQNQLFTQFFRSPEAIRLEPNGNGLGLYFAQSIASLHNTRITISSSPEGRVTFAFSLAR